MSTPDGKRVLNVIEHKVRTGETLDSVAQAHGMTWRELAQFNWGTQQPDRINHHLYKEVGCRKKTADGKNYVFDDGDEPGKIYVPRAWRQDGLMTDMTHTIRVRPLRTDTRRRRIRLFDWYSQPMAGAPYRVDADGQEICRGNADAHGDITLPDTPATMCTVYWGTRQAVAPPSEPVDQGPPPLGTSSGGEGDQGASSSSAPGQEFEFEREIFLDVDSAVQGEPADHQDATRKRLSNMGYASAPVLAHNVRAFQRDAGQDITGLIEDAEDLVCGHHDEQCQPPGEGEALA